jgi:hypothetical protein
MLMCDPRAYVVAKSFNVWFDGGASNGRRPVRKAESMTCPGVERWSRTLSPCGQKTIVRLLGEKIHANATTARSAIANRIYSIMMISYGIN